MNSVREEKIPELDDFVESARTRTPRAQSQYSREAKQKMRDMLGTNGGVQAQRVRTAARRRKVKHVELFVFGLEKERRRRRRNKNVHGKA